MEKGKFICNRVMVGEKVVVHYSGLTKDLFPSGSYPAIQIYDDKASKVHDTHPFFDFILDKVREVPPSSGTVELRLPDHPGTVEVFLGFYSQEHERKVKATIPITVIPKNDPTPPTPPQPPQPNKGIDPKLTANYWTCSFIGGASYTDMANYFFYKDGIFVYDTWLGYTQRKYVGEYSVSNGEIHFTDIKEYHQKNNEKPFYGNAGSMDTYTFSADMPDRTLPYVFVTDDQGESLRIGRIDAAILSPSPLQFRKMSIKTGDGENNTQGGTQPPDGK